MVQHACDACENNLANLQQREYYVVARNMERWIDGAGRYKVFFGV